MLPYVDERIKIEPVEEWPYRELFHEYLKFGSHPSHAHESDQRIIKINNSQLWPSLDKITAENFEEITKDTIKMMLTRKY